jgi:hypothetical protein
LRTRSLAPILTAALAAIASPDTARAQENYEIQVYGSETMPVGTTMFDKQFGAWYVSLNPTVEHGLRGETSAEGFEFAPKAVVNVDATRKVNVGVEYYGGMGPIRNIAPRAEQEHQLFGVVNLDRGPDWEFNAGYGVGLTAPAEKRMVKLILGRRVGK